LRSPLQVELREQFGLARGEFVRVAADRDLGDSAENVLLESVFTASGVPERTLVDPPSSTGFWSACPPEQEAIIDGPSRHWKIHGSHCGFASGQPRGRVPIGKIDADLLAGDSAAMADLKEALG